VLCWECLYSCCGASERQVQVFAAAVPALSVDSRAVDSHLLMYRAKGDSGQQSLVGMCTSGVLKQQLHNSLYGGATCR
jgi:hypothetical protein